MQELRWTLFPFFIISAYPQRVFWQNAASVWQMLPCICLNVHGSQVKTSSVSDASEWELQRSMLNGVTSWGERAADVESEGLELERDREKRALFIEGTLQGHPSTSV